MKLNFYSGRHLRRGNTWSPRSQVTNQVRPKSHDDHLGPRGLSICCSFHFFLLLLPSSFNALKLAHYSLLYFQILFFFFLKKTQKFRSFSGSKIQPKIGNVAFIFLKIQIFLLFFFTKLKSSNEFSRKSGPTRWPAASWRDRCAPQRPDVQTFFCVTLIRPDVFIIFNFPSINSFLQTKKKNNFSNFVQNLHKFAWNR